MIEGIKRNARIYVGDSIFRKKGSRLSERDDVVDSLPGAKIDHVTEIVGIEDMGRGIEGSILVHVMANNEDRQ